MSKLLLVLVKFLFILQVAFFGVEGKKSCLNNDPIFNSSYYCHLGLSGTRTYHFLYNKQTPINLFVKSNFLNEWTHLTFEVDGSASSDTFNFQDSLRYDLVTYGQNISLTFNIQLEKPIILGFAFGFSRDNTPLNISIDNHFRYTSPRILTVSHVKDVKFPFHYKFSGPVAFAVSFANFSFIGSDYVTLINNGVLLQNITAQSVTDDSITDHIIYSHPANLIFDGVISSSGTFFSAYSYTLLHETGKANLCLQTYLVDSVKPWESPPFSGKLDFSVRCMAIISAKKGEHVKVTLESNGLFDEFDKVIVHDRGRLLSPVLGVLDKNSKIGTVVSSSGNSLMLELITDNIRKCDTYPVNNCTIKVKFESSSSSNFTPIFGHAHIPVDGKSNIILHLHVSKSELSGSLSLSGSFKGNISVFRSADNYQPGQLLYNRVSDSKIEFSDMVYFDERAILFLDVYESLFNISFESLSKPSPVSYLPEDSVDVELKISDALGVGEFTWIRPRSLHRTDEEKIALYSINIPPPAFLSFFNSCYPDPLLKPTFILNSTFPSNSNPIFSASTQSGFRITLANCSKCTMHLSYTPLSVCSVQQYNATHGEYLSPGFPESIPLMSYCSLDLKPSMANESSSVGLLLHEMLPDSIESLEFQEIVGDTVQTTWNFRNSLSFHDIVSSSGSYIRVLYNSQWPPNLLSPHLPPAFSFFKINYGCGGTFDVTDANMSFVSHSLPCAYVLSAVDEQKYIQFIEVNVIVNEKLTLHDLRCTPGSKCCLEIRDGGNSVSNLLAPVSINVVNGSTVWMFKTTSSHVHLLGISDAKSPCFHAEKPKTLKCEESLACTKRNICMPPSWLCDGIDQCDMIDELDCYVNKINYMSKGSIAGIVISCFVVGILATLVIFFILYKRRVLGFGYKQLDLSSI